MKSNILILLHFLLAVALVGHLLELGSPEQLAQAINGLDLALCLAWLVDQLLQP